MSQIPDILIVEDDADWLDIYVTELTSEEYNIVKARTVNRALRLIKDREFALVATDLRLSGVNNGGFDILEVVRQICPVTEVIIFSGVATKEDAYEAIRQGAFNYLTKPLDIKQVKHVINAGIIKYKQNKLRPNSFRKRILAVDDNQAMIDLLKDALPTLGFDADFTIDGEQAIEMLKEQLYDLVLTDIRMAEVNGLDVARAAYRYCPDTPVLFISGNPNVEVEERSFLSKPFTITQLESKLHFMLQRKKRFDTELVLPFKEEIKQLQQQFDNLVAQSHGNYNQVDQIDTYEISLGELGLLTSGIVHDLRGGIGILRNSVRRIFNKVGGVEFLTADLQQAAYDIEFCEVAIRNLTTLGSGGHLNPSLVNIENIFQETFYALERRLTELEIVVDVRPDAQYIIGDKDELKQLFFSLIKNASEAMPDGGKLSFRTIFADERYQIEISDTGCGISEKDLAGIFDYRFTTKRKDFGVGLYIAQRIVQRHAGTVQVISARNQGTTFTISFPATRRHKIAVDSEKYPDREDILYPIPSPVMKH